METDKVCEKQFPLWMDITLKGRKKFSELLYTFSKFSANDWDITASVTWK